MNGTVHPATRQTTSSAASQPRQTYQTPRVTPLGEWKALTLANSIPTTLGLPEHLFLS